MSSTRNHDGARAFAWITFGSFYLFAVMAIWSHPDDTRWRWALTAVVMLFVSVVSAIASSGP